MLMKAVQICEAKFGVLFRCYNHTEFAAVWVGVPPAYEQSLRQRGSFRCRRPIGRPGAAMKKPHLIGLSDTANTVGVLAYSGFCTVALSANPHGD
jgi:hypothetical protein